MELSNDSACQSNQPRRDSFEDIFEFRVPSEAPVFKPTHEEFRDPLAYINKIRPIAEKYGVCKIRPPLDWHPPFAVDIGKFRFTPRVQRLNELEAKTRIKLNFLDQIAKFWELQGSSLKIPVVEKKILDLYTLHKIVHSEGGAHVVTRGKRWRKIAARMGLPESRAFGPILKLHYDRILLPFDIFQSSKVIAQQKCEVNGGASTDSNEMKRPFFGPGQKMNVYNHRKSEKPPNMGFSSEVDPLAKYICQTCHRGDVEESMLLCDGCDDSYHTFCLVPPLSDIPKGDWRCPKCVAVEVSKPIDPFGFEQAKREYTLQEFGEMADQFKSDYFNMPVYKVPTTLVEQEFWRIVSSIDEDITVEYGADLHTMDHGSGFPTRESINEKFENPDIMEYVDSQWNLNNIPVLECSVLSHITPNISGMKVPWMYVGMCFATFCWHNEDHWSYSINYLHWGEPKTWYGVPGSSADLFEATMKKAAPELFLSQPDLLHQLTTIMNPNVLMDAGVPVYRTDQQAGEFVITFPRAYHAGFNQGYNFAEAVNFAPADWLKMGRDCITHYSSLHRYCVFSHDELVCKMAINADKLDPRLAAATYKDMLQMVETEKQLRKNLLEWGVCEAEREAYELVPDDARQCEFCKTTCFLSAVTCGCNRIKVVCLHHFSRLCECPPQKHILRYRYTMDELPIMLQKVKLKAESFDSWVNSVKSALHGNQAKKIDLVGLKNLLLEAEEKKFPDSLLLQSLISSVREAEKCTNIAKQLQSNRMRTRARTGNECKMNLEELIEFTNQVDSLICVIEEAEALKKWTEQAIEYKKQAGEYLRSENPSASAVRTLINEGLSLDLDFSEIDLLNELLRVLEWAEEASEFLTFEDDISMKNLRAMANKGISFCCSSFKIPNRIITYTAQIQLIIRVAEKWETKTTEILAANPPVSYEEFNEHLNDGRLLPVSLKNFDKLQQIVASAIQWIHDVEMLYDEDSISSNGEIEELLSRASKLPMSLNQVHKLKENLKFRKKWIDGVSKIFLEEDSDLDLLQVLFPSCDSSKTRKSSSSIFSSLKSGVGLKRKFLKRLYEHARIGEFSAVKMLRHTNKSQKVKVTSESNCCICSSKQKSPLVECALCWAIYHEQCLPKKWRTRKSGSCPYEMFVCQMCKRTKRPRLSVIRPFIIDLKNAQLRFLEGESLKLLIERMKTYQFRVGKAFNNAEVKKAIELASVDDSNPKKKTKDDAIGEDSKKQDAHKSTFNLPFHISLDKVRKNVVFSKWVEIKLQEMLIEGTLLEASLSETEILYEVLQASKLNQKSKEERREKRKFTSDDEDEVDPCAARPCLSPIENKVDWVQCDKCNLWFHLFCIGMDKRELNEDDDFVCVYCEQSTDKRKLKKKKFQVKKVKGS